MWHVNYLSYLEQSRTLLLWCSLCSPFHFKCCSFAWQIHFVFCNNGGLSFFWLFRPATIQSSSPFSCRAWMPSIHISQVLYVWELKFMHLSRTWECIVIPLSRLLHYTLFNSQCKPMYTYIFIQTSCSQNLFFLRLLAALSMLWRLHQGGLCWAGNGWKRGIWDFILQDEDRYFIADALQQIMDYMEESLRFWADDSDGFLLWCICSA